MRTVSSPLPFSLRQQISRKAPEVCPEEHEESLQQFFSERHTMPQERWIEAALMEFSPLLEAFWRRYYRWEPLPDERYSVFTMALIEVLLGFEYRGQKTTIKDLVRKALFDKLRGYYRRRFTLSQREMTVPPEEFWRYPTPDRAHDAESFRPKEAGEITSLLEMLCDERGLPEDHIVLTWASCDPDYTDAIFARQIGKSASAVKKMRQRVVPQVLRALRSPAK